MENSINNEINFISSKPDSYETRTMRTKSNNVEIMIGSKTDEIIEELLQRYQKGLEESMGESEFIFDDVNALYYDFNKISLSRGKSYTDSPEWLKNKKAKINPKNDDHKYFQYALTVALTYEKIKSHPERIAKIKPLFDQYNSVKSLSALLRGITGNNNGHFYCLNCFRSYTTKNRLKKHKNVCENHDYCYVEMPEKDKKIVKYNHGEKSMTAPFVACADLKCLLEKMSTCHNDPKKSSTTKVNKHPPSGYLLFTCSSFDKIENKLDYYRGKDCMKKFWEGLKKHDTRIITYEKKEMIPLTKQEEKIYRRQKNVIYAKKNFVLMIAMKSIVK